MSVQQFCLRWNNHQPNFISVFSTLLHNETLVDVTLAAEGRQLQAHKVVLSACSSYFQTLFTSNPCQHPIVILKDVQYNHLKTMVNFMYYGEVNVSQEQLPDILKTAEMLKIKGLAEMPDSITKSESKSSSSDHIEHTQTGGGSESIWGSTESQPQFHQQQQQRRTPSPASLSPSTRRKRLRKSSTGSGSASTERTSEEQSSIDGGSNLNMGPMDPMTGFGGHSGNITPNINNTRMMKESSTETDPPHQESSQKANDSMGNVNQNMPLDIPGSTATSGNTSSVSCSQSQAGVQWTLIDSNYPRFALSSYQAGLGMQTPTGQSNTIQQQSNNNNSSNNSNNNSQNSNNNHNNNNNNNSNNNNNNSNNHHHTNASSNQVSNPVQMQYQNISPYSPQIISVNPNNLMNNYPSSNLSTPTSPQAGHSMVQTVYSQGPTPSQSPVEMGGPGSAGSNSNIPIKRKRSINPQGDENFIRALDAVRYGGIGFCKAARLYGVNNRTLWLEYKKRGYPISRPSIKNRIKLEPNMTPPLSSPKTEENTMETYDHMTPTALNMATVPPSEQTTPLMCPPHAHPMGVMSFLDTRHVDFPTALHPPNLTRQRYPDPTVNVNPAAMNLQGLNFNTM